MNKMNLNNLRSTLGWENKEIKNKYNSLSIAIDASSLRLLIIATNASLVNNFAINVHKCEEEELKINTNA